MKLIKVAALIFWMGLVPTTSIMVLEQETAAAVPVNGACGSSNAKTLATAPTAGLCATGTASTVTGNGPWNWTCAGHNGGTTAQCSASLKATLQPAASSDRFVDSLGINTHLTYVGQAYWNYLTTPAANGNTTVSIIQRLGIRHIRESIDAAISFGPALCGAMRTISANGASWDFYTNYQYVGNTIKTTTASALGTALTCLNGNPASLMAFEGPNEMDTYPAGYCPDAICTAEVLQQAAMTKAARNAGTVPSTTAIFAASSANGECADNATWGQANGGQLGSNIDFTNNHGYFGNFQPDIPATGGSVCGLAPPYGSWRYFVAAAGLMASNHPVVTTETGYTDGCCGVTGEATSVDPVTKTKYEMRDVLGYFVNGSYYTFLYDLATDSTGTFGLTDQYLNPKPAFTALENLIRILSDPGPSFSPPGLAVTISVPSDVSSLLLGKRDGSYWLVLWQNDSSFNTSTHTPITVAPTTGTLKFSTFPDAIVRYVFSPSTGGVTVSSISAQTTVTVPISDTPEVIQIGESSAITLANP